MIRGACLLALGLAAGGCASASGPPPSPVLDPETAAAPPVDWLVPEEERVRPNPLAPSGDSLATGRALFGRYCTACHGDRGRGDGPVAALWARLPKDLTNPVRQARLTDGEIFYKISHGHHDGSEVIMPGISDKVPADNRWKIVLYVRSLDAAAP